MSFDVRSVNQALAGLPARLERADAKAAADEKKAYDSERRKAEVIATKWFAAEGCSAGQMEKILDGIARLGRDFMSRYLENALGPKSKAPYDPFFNEHPIFGQDRYVKAAQMDLDLDQLGRLYEPRSGKSADHVRSATRQDHLYAADRPHAVTAILRERILDEIEKPVAKGGLGLGVVRHHTLLGIVENGREQLAVYVPGTSYTAV